jgi:hypothetical protein
MIGVRLAHLNARWGSFNFTLQHVHPLLQAIFVYWSEIGRLMGIQDIPETYDEFRQWSFVCGLRRLVKSFLNPLQQYEVDNLVPSKESHELAKKTFKYFVRRLPTVFGLQEAGERLLLCFIDERLRRAMMLVGCSVIYSMSPAHGVLGFLTHHLSLLALSMPCSKCARSLFSTFAFHESIRRYSSRWTTL